MSHLAEVYAKDLGVKMGRPIFLPHYSPLPYGAGSYITLHNSEKIPAKNYSYWAEVVYLLKIFAPEYRIVQVGHGEKPIDGIDLFFNGTIKQSAFIIKNAACHIGVDSGPVHIASALNTPIIALYSNSRPENAGPLWNTTPAICIESNRGGRMCSAANDENPRSIDMIMPEEIVAAASEVLGFNYTPIKTLHIGKRYKERYIEIIPAAPSTSIADNCVIRIDILQKYSGREYYPQIEQNAASYLYNTNTPAVIIAEILSEEFLRYFKGQIGKIIWISDNFDAPEYKVALSLGIPQEYLCSDKEKIADERFKNIELEISPYYEKEQIAANKEKLESLLSAENLQYKTNRTVVCGGKIYPGIQWWVNEGIENPDNDFFWLDTDMMWIFRAENP